MKYLEDFYPGQVLEFSSKGMSESDIMGFAHEWDPQRLHTDVEYATQIHGGLIASGFQTMLVIFEPVMREMMVDVANIGGIGFDTLRWLRPVHPDEPLDIRLVVDSVTPSRSKPDRGVLKYSLEATNPAGETVFTTVTPVMMYRRKDSIQ